MIDNLNLIKPLLNFDDEDDFYMLYVLKRKKDQSTDKANHQSVRTIRSYCIKSVEQLEERYDEIKMLCEMFKARAYIHIQKQNHKDVSLDMLVTLAERIKSGQHKQQGLFDSVVGQLKTHEKRWVIDIDFRSIEFAQQVSLFIDELRPQGNKNEAYIPTKNGYHLITRRFDVMEFKKKYPDIDIQKKNPTLLYLPESLYSMEDKAIDIMAENIRAVVDKEIVEMIVKSAAGMDQKLDSDLTEEMNQMLINKIGNEPTKPREW
jgi:hypothetical protein